VCIQRCVSLTLADRDDLVCLEALGFTLHNLLLFLLLLAHFLCHLTGLAHLALLLLAVVLALAVAEVRLGRFAELGVGQGNGGGTSAIACCSSTAVSAVAAADCDIAQEALAQPRVCCGAKQGRGEGRRESVSEKVSRESGCG